MNKRETPNAQEFGQIRALLAKHGVRQSDINAVIGNAPNGRTRQQIADELRAWFRTRPKAET